MNEAKILAIKSAIYQMGLRFNQEPSKEKIEAYAHDLRNFTPDQITHAFREVIKSGTAFFPSMAEILKHLSPSNENSSDVSNMIANEIIDKCTEKGRYRTDEILKELSPISKDIVSKNRHLIMEIMDSSLDKLPTIRAQIRDLAKGVLENMKAKKHNETLEALGLPRSNVLKLERGEPKKLNFTHNLPKDPA